MGSGVFPREEMLDEQARRRSTFSEGTTIRLADGQFWSLPGRRSDHSDPEYDATFVAIFEAEDVAERLRAELALTILLLSRNSDPTPEQFQEPLGFPPDSPSLLEMQRAVHEMVLDRARTWTGPGPGSALSGSRMDPHKRRWIRLPLNEA